METRITSSPRIAASFIRNGGIAAFPTETVYGLGADAFNAPAVRSIFKAKGRPSDNPLIIHLGDLSQISSVARRLPRSAEQLLEKFSPGPLTVIVPRHASVPFDVTAGLDTVGIRIPLHPIATAFLLQCGTPVAAPSANRSGRPSPTTWTATRDELAGRIPCILKGGASDVGLESTVVDCTSSRPVVLREGAVSIEELQRVISSIRVAGQVLTKNQPPRSPGLKYRHYSPSLAVKLVNGPEEVPVKYADQSAYIGINSRGFPKQPGLVLTCREVRDYAQRLFHFFRVCERSGLKAIYCQKVPESGLGRALMDRLQKAAGDQPTGS